MRALLVTAVVSLGTALNLRAACIQHSFKAPQNEVKQPTNVIGTADFDGDGKVDQLVVHNGSFYRNFTIELASGRTVDVPVLNATALIDDANGDGRPDLISLDTFSRKIIVLLNRGDATFTEKDSPIIPSSVAFPGTVWADFNGDGRKDLFIEGTIDPFLASAFVYISAGDGTFVRQYGLPVESGYFMFAEDVNGDGRADLFFHRNDFELIVYLAQDHGFAPAQSLAIVYGFPSGLPDLNGDGRADVVISNSPSQGDYFTIVYDFSGPPRFRSTQISGALRLTADFNGDGAPDLLVESHVPGANGSILISGLQVWLNNHDGTFRLTDQLPGYHTIESVTDWDGDGVPDLVVNDGSRFVLHGNGDGTFRVPRVAFPAASAALVGDFDGDGADDIALPNAIAWNNGDNTFHMTAINDPRLQHAIHAVDANRDGRKELVSIIPGAVVVFSPQRDGSIVEVGRIPARPVDATVGDFTGKHRPEVALLPDQLYSVEVYDLQTGALQFVANITPRPRALAVADVNGDGMDDLLVSGGTVESPGGSTPPVDGFVSVFLSTGASFGPEQRMQYPRVLDHLVSGDFNGDGKTDIAGDAVNLLGDVAVFYGDGSGAFPHADRLTAAVDHVSDYVTSLEAVDLDGDGRTDLLINGTEAVFYGTATGLRAGGNYFGPRSDPFTTPAYTALAVRSGRTKLPWIIEPTRFSDIAYVYEPACAETRLHAVRP